jgi:hypothetical protein
MLVLDPRFYCVVNSGIFIVPTGNGGVSRLSASLEYNDNNVESVSNKSNMSSKTRTLSAFLVSGFTFGQGISITATDWSQ